MVWRGAIGKSYSMATVLLPGFRNEFRRSVYTTSKCCDWYPKFWLQPIYQKKDQEAKGESGELSTIAHLPIRPAPADNVQSVWHDPEVARFRNIIMEDGKKVLARHLVEKAFENLKRMQLKKYYEETDEVARAKIELNPYVIFHQAIINATPKLETISMKRGGHAYQVPVPMKDHKGRWKAMKWLMEASMEKEDDLRFYIKLSWELLDAYNDTGRVIKRKQEQHKLCEANRAYAHFRWS